MPYLCNIQVYVDHYIFESSITLLPVVLVLRNTRIHVGFSDHSDITIYVKRPVNKTFCFCTILEIPNIDPNHSQVEFGRSLDNLRTRC